MRPDEDEDLGAAEAAPPGAPCGVEVTEVEATKASIKWKEPLSDGGSPIKEYQVEYRLHKSGEEWTEGPRVKPKKYLTAVVEELANNNKYEFRISAISRSGGQGPPSDSSGPVMVKAIKAPPKIDIKALVLDQDVGGVVCKVNQQLVLEVPVEGAPEPECRWFIMGSDGQQELHSHDNIRVKASGNVAKFMLIPATRGDSATYLLEAKNKWGQDAAEFKVEVLGKPAIPTGPLKVSEVTKRSCLLEWKPPADNGGHHISHYEVEKMDETQGQWLPVKTTKGLSLQVLNLVEGRRYKFLVRAVNQDGDSPDLETTEAIIAKNPFDPPGKGSSSRMTFQKTF